MTETIDNKINFPFELIDKLTSKVIMDMETDKLVDWYDQLNSPEVIRIKESKKRAATRNIDNKINDLLGIDVDYVSKSKDERTEKAVEVVSEMALMWHNARYGKNATELTEQEVDDFIDLAGISPERLIGPAYGTGLMGIVKYVRDNEASLDTSDPNNRYLAKIRDTVVDEIEGKQDKIMSKIKSELTSNHSHYEGLLSKTKSLTETNIGTKASAPILMMELDNYFSKRLENSIKKSYNE
jgi:hypothetical protein